MKSDIQDKFAPNSATDSGHLNAVFAGRWTLMALVGLVPVAIHLGMHDTFDLPKWTLIYLGALVLLGSWLAQVLTAEKPAIYFTPLDMPLALLLTVMTISTFQSLDKPVSIFGYYRVYTFGLIPHLFAFMLYWLAVQFFMADRDRNASSTYPDSLLKIGALSAAVVALYGILQYFGMGIFRRMPSAEYSRVWSTMGNPLWLGGYLAMVGPVSIYLMAKNAGRALPARAFSYALIALVMGCMVLTLSRSAWLGFLVAMMVSLLMLAKVRSGSGRHGIEGRSLNIAMVSCSLLILVLSVFAPARDRILSAFNPAEGTNMGRFEGWRVGLKVLVKRTWLGTGPDTFGIAFRKHKTMDYVRYQGQGKIQAHAHNDFVQYLVTVGVFGAGAYLWLWVTFFYAGFSALKKMASVQPAGENALLMALALFASVTAYFAQNQFNFAAASSVMLFAIFSALFFASAGKTRKVVFVNPMNESLGKNVAGVALAGLLVAAYYLVKPALADIAFQKARALSPSDPLASFQQFESAVKLNPRNVLYIQEIGNFCRNEANLSEEIEVRKSLIRKAVEYYQINLNKHPYDADGYSNMGVALMWMTQLGGEDHRSTAKLCFEKATELDPTFSEFWAHRARVEHFMGNVPNEIAIWEKVLLLDPNHESANRLLPGLRNELKVMSK